MLKSRGSEGGGGGRQGTQRPEKGGRKWRHLASRCELQGFTQVLRQRAIGGAAREGKKAGRKNLQG
ncbi:rCG47123 [Rattus norvegicus]|uniref:RCG47123 n=1 Tax=Rattus norvegicus TaxID=10116 RepID=A6I0S6_RAT|nr:rCG47123 [Rattus norvegicus]